MEYGRPWTAIVNTALAKIGREPVESINGVGGRGTPAPIARNQLAISVDSVLASKAWRCLTEEVKLQRMQVTPAKFLYRYALPLNYVRLSEYGVRTERDLPYELKGRYIDTDSEWVILDYVAEPADASAMPVWMRNLVACHLAYAIGPLLNAEASLIQAVGAEFNQQLVECYRLDNADKRDEVTGSYIADSLERDRTI